MTSVEHAAGITKRAVRVIRTAPSSVSGSLKTYQAAFERRLGLDSGSSGSR